jgi:hypothetical protein
MFADMSLDNRTVEKFAALAATSGSLWPFETSPLTRRPNVSPRLIVL